MLWRCWLGGRKGIRPVKNWVVGCWHGLQQGGDLHMAQLMPLPHTVSCFGKIQIGFTFLVSAHLGSPGPRAVKWVCVPVVSNESMRLVGSFSWLGIVLWFSFSALHCWPDRKGILPVKYPCYYHLYTCASSLPYQAKKNQGEGELRNWFNWKIAIITKVVVVPSN